MTSVVAAQKMPAAMLSTSPMIAEGRGRLSLSENTSTTPPKASASPTNLASDIRSPSRKCAPTSTQNGMVLTISALRATAGVFEPDEDAGELRAEQEAGEQPGRQRAVAIEQPDAAIAAPQEDQHAGDRRAGERQEDRVEAGIGELGGDAVQPPREGEHDHDRHRGDVDGVAAVERVRTPRSFFFLRRCPRSKPSRFQLCRICGGSGAVTSITPPSGMRDDDAARMQMQPVLDAAREIPVLVGLEIFRSRR